MHIPLVFHALVLSLAAGALGAQNLVTNGDFEAGTTTTGAPKGWTLSGYACTQNVNMADVTGGGASNCFNCRPGGKTTPKPYPPNIMEQDVLLIPGVVHEFRADIMAARPNSTVGNADAGTFEVFVDGVSIAKKAFGGISPPAIHRTRLCARIVPKSVGKKKLRITFHRNYTCNTNTPVSYIDNIFLGRTAGLTICFPGERKAARSVQMSAQGNAGYKFAIFIGVKKSVVPLPIPGWTGQWELATPHFPLVIGNLDTSGRWSLNVPLPAGAKGAKAWVQGAQAGPRSTIVNLGYAQEVNVY
ncbi:MAG: hypothetical protein ACYTKC_04165 [Planctomycetota bacterium]|jgi:hypothetical protein